jgi:hypothetical protein
MVNINRITEEQKFFRLDPYTLNKNLIFWLTKSNCVTWDLKRANKEYDALREEYDHATAFEKLKKKMFDQGLK